MGYKCRVCGTNEVSYPGDVCELCAIGLDPFAREMSESRLEEPQDNSEITASHEGGYSPKRGPNRRVLLNGGASLKKRDPYGNDMTVVPTRSTSVKVYAPGQVPTESTSDEVEEKDDTGMVSKGPITAGIIKNVAVDNQKKSILTKWISALFSGVPFTLDDEITMFQVFPDYTGTSFNSLGNACDQVIVYGKVNNGVVSENNEVEVYGKRDSHNNIVAKTIKNTASGTTISPQWSFSPAFVWLITIIALTLAVKIVLVMGVKGIIWALVLLFCVTHLPLVIKIVGICLGAALGVIRWLFRCLFR